MSIKKKLNGHVPDDPMRLFAEAGARYWLEVIRREFPYLFQEPMGHPPLASLSHKARALVQAHDMERMHAPYGINPKTHLPYKMSPQGRANIARGLKAREKKS